MISMWLINDVNFKHKDANSKDNAVLFMVLLLLLVISITYYSWKKYLLENREILLKDYYKH